MGFASSLSIENAILSEMDEAAIQKLRTACMTGFIDIVRTTKIESWRAQASRYLTSAPFGAEGVILAAKTISDLAGIPKLDPSAFTFDGSDPDWSKVAIALRDHGLAVVTNYLPPAALGEAVAKTTEFADLITPLYDERVNVERDTWIFRGDPSSSDLKSYQDFAASPKTLVTARRNSLDYGVIDAFNIDKYDTSLHGLAETFIRRPEIRNAFNAAYGGTFAESNLNLYINENKESGGTYRMRDFHKDGMRMVKSFIYLTDCPDERFGPYTVVPNTHKPGVFHTFNKQINAMMGWHQGELRIVDRDRAIPCTGLAGTLILSSQAGAHRGIVQQEGYGRRLLTQSYFAKEGARANIAKARTPEPPPKAFQKDEPERRRSLLSRFLKAS